MNPSISNGLRAFLPVAFFSLFISFSVFAQNEQGRIAGRVLDQNGAVVSGASVTVTNVGTNETRTAAADTDGNYSVPALRAAVYKVSATAQNFAAKTVTGVQVSVGQQLDLDITLSAQAQTVTVNVTDATEAAIDTSSARIGATVNQREVKDLPLNGRQVSQLELQAPGTVNTGTGTFGDIRFSGRSNQQNVIRYDGVEGSAIIDASPGNLNGEVASPFRLQSSLENIQEFRADSNNYPAELGTGTGGQINVVTKSGTNQFHGSLFEYFRNDRPDARSFFDNAAPGIPKSKLRLNQFGGSIGGPVYLPRFGEGGPSAYSGKDRLFFFFSYEGYRVRAGINNVELVPSLGSATNADLSAPGAVIPGTTTPVNPAIQHYLAGFRGQGVVIIPGIAETGLDIGQLQGTEATNENAFFGRIDYRLNDRNSFYLRYQRDSGRDLAPEGVSGRNILITAIPQNAAFGYQSVITPNLINDFRIGLNAAETTIGGVAPTINGIDYSAITINVSGTTANLPGNTIAGQGASAGISTPGGLVRANSATNGRGQPYTPYSLSFIDSVNFVKDNHNTKFGGEIRQLSLKTDRLGGTTYTFPNFNNFLAGNLQQIQYLGDLSATSPFTGASGERTGRETFYIVYGQDEWKIRPNLTVNYGLRYEYYSPLREKNNAQIYFDIRSGGFRPATQDPFLTAKNNFGPRVAVTYSPFYKSNGFFGGNRTVIRAGFGLYYGPGQIEDQIQPIESDRVSSTLTGSTVSLVSGQQLFTFPADTNAIAANFAANPNNRQYQPRAYAPDYKVPERITQYSISLQQELPYKLVGTIAYVGSIGRNLFLRSVANQILPGNATVSNIATAFPTGVGVINRINAAGQVTGVTTARQFDILNNAAACNASVTNPICRPFAEIDYKTSGGRDRYDALQTGLSRRFDTGLTLNAQYTYSSSRGNTSGSNDARTSAQLDNFAADFGRNTFDVRHSFNFSALYNLPIGKGKTFDLGNNFVNYALGGWDVGTIINARSGLPIEVNIVRPDVVVQCQQAGGCPVNAANPASGIFAQGFVANLPSFGSSFPALPQGFVAVVNTPGGGTSRNIRRPDLISGASPYLNNDRNILNPAAFTTPAPGTFGNLPRNAFEGPGFNQVDLTLSRRFQVAEKVGIQFRTEIFNVFNRTNFANPSATLNNVLPSLSYNAATGNFSAGTTNILQPRQAYTQAAGGQAFGQIRQTVGRTVGLGTNRQIQFALRLDF